MMLNKAKVSTIIVSKNGGNSEAKQGKMQEVSNSENLSRATCKNLDSIFWKVALHSLQKKKKRKNHFVLHIRSFKATLLKNLRKTYKAKKDLLHAILELGSSSSMRILLEHFSIALA